jgi:hypothetical protein
MLRIVILLFGILCGSAYAEELCSSLVAEGEFQSFSSKRGLVETPKLVPIRIGSSTLDIESGVLHISNIGETENSKIIALSDELSEQLFDVGLHSRVRGRRGENALIHQIPMNSRPLVMSPLQTNSALDRINAAAKIFRRVLQLRSEQGTKLSYQMVLKDLGLSIKSRLAVLHLLQHLNQNVFTTSLLDSPDLSLYPFMIGIEGFDLYFGDKGELSLVKSSAADSDWGAGVSRKLASKVLPSVEVGVSTHFEMLRNRIIEHSRSWTGAEGEVVVLAPSEVDVAFSEAAHFAKQTGLRLVFAGDLVISDQGEIELPLEEGGKVVRVIGIQSFLPQSYLLYEPQTDKRIGFPMVQNFVSNEDLGNRLNLRLRRGVWYDYVLSELDPNSQPTDIRRDERRRPKFANPVVPVFRAKGDTAVSAVSALRARKFYVSSLAKDWMSDEAVMRDLFNVVSLEQGRGSETSVEWWVRHDITALASVRAEIDRDQHSQLAAMVDPAAPVFNDSIDDSLFFGRTSPEQSPSVDHAVRLRNFQLPASYRVVSDSGSGRYVQTNRAARIRIFPVSSTDGEMELAHDAAVARVAALQVGSFNIAEGASYAPVQMAKGSESKEPKSESKLVMPMSQDESERLKRLSEAWNRVIGGLGEGRSGLQRLDLELIVNLCSRLAHRLPDGWVRVSYAAERLLHQKIGFADFQKELTKFQVEGVAFARSAR